MGAEPFDLLVFSPGIRVEVLNAGAIGMGDLGELIVDAHHGKGICEASSFGTLTARAPHLAQRGEDAMPLVEMRHILGIDLGEVTNSDP